MKLNSIINTVADSLIGRVSGGATPFRKTGAVGSRRVQPGQDSSLLCFWLPLTPGVQSPRVPIQNTGCAPGTPACRPAKLKTMYASPCFPELSSREQEPEVPCGIRSWGLRVTPEPGLEFIINVPALYCTHILLKRFWKFLVLFLSVFFNSSFVYFYPSISGCLQ